MAHEGRTGRQAVDFGIFAHNEAEVIADLIADLSRQVALTREDLDLRVMLMANGCSDATAARAQEAVAALPEGLQDRFVIHDLAEGGKSRTVHRFIHDTARGDAVILGFMDADIRLPQTDTLGRMIDGMLTRSELHAFTSRPVKDVVHDKLEVGLVPRLIAAGGDGLTNFRKSICGQLYILRGDMARSIGLPAGLPVEDGFVRAMVVTDLLSRDQDLTRIDGDPAVYHVYESIRSIPDLIHHQTRLIVGSAINAALYGKFRREGHDRKALQDLLMQTARNPDWLAGVLKTELPRRPFGYVPFRFLTNRIGAFRKFGRRSPKALAVLLVGLGLDSVVYVKASLRMWRGAGSGFW